MIVAPLSEASLYTASSPGLERGFEFLRRSDLAELKDGRHEVDGDQVFAIIARELGRGKAESPLEYHRRYLDIQYVVSGTEIIGWQAASRCRHLAAEFDAERDLGFFRDRPATWCVLQPGDFAIFFPNDAHAPLAGTGPIHKVVVKVAIG